MTTAQMLLDTFRRQIIRIITLGLGALALTFVVIVAAMLIRALDLGLITFLIDLLLFLLGAGITLATIDHWPLLRAVLPINIGLFLIIGSVGLLLPELAQPAAPFLAMNVLLMALTGNQRFTLIVAILSTLLAMVIVSGLPRPFPGLSVAAVAAPVRILAAGAFVCVFWIVASRIVISQNLALALAEQRADEADTARAEADAARIEVERQNAEQARLLELVRTLELPVISVGLGLLVLPLVGDLDRRRITTIQQQLFAQLAAQRAHTVVLDLTAISAMDEAVVAALLQTAQGVRLLGAQMLFSGMRAEVAQAIARLDQNTSAIRSFSNLGQAIAAVQGG